MNVTEYIKQIQSYEEYSFSWDEILENCKSPVPTIRKELIRLTEKNEVLNLRHGFYIIIPPRYQNLKKLPIHLYVEKLFKTLNKRLNKITIPKITKGKNILDFVIFSIFIFLALLLLSSL